MLIGLSYINTIGGLPWQLAPWFVRVELIGLGKVVSCNGIPDGGGSKLWFIRLKTWSICELKSCNVGDRCAINFVKLLTTFFIPLNEQSRASTLSSTTC